MLASERDEIISALSPATSSVWWEVTLRQLAEVNQLKEMLIGFAGKRWAAQRADLQPSVEQMDLLLWERLAPLWQARNRLQTLCPLAWAKTSGFQSMARLTPDAAAQMVHDALGIFLERYGETRSELAKETTKPQAPAKTYRHRNPPTDAAIQAYRLVKFLGKNQADAARTLYTTQASVSRWVKQVGEWVAAGNILPEEARPKDASRRKPLAMDPRTLEQGPRLDRGRKGKLPGDGDDD